MRHPGSHAQSFIHTRTHRGTRSYLSRFHRRLRRSSRAASSFLRGGTSFREPSRPDNGTPDTAPDNPSEVSVDQVSFFLEFFHIDHVNMRGLYSHSAELAAHFPRYGYPSLITFNETFFNRAVQRVSLAGYVEVSRFDRRNGQDQGGITFFTRACYSERVVFLEHGGAFDERSWHCLHSDVGPVLICVCYRPPNRGELDSIYRFISEWSRLSASHIGTLVLGDLNIHHTHWLGSSHTDIEGTLLFHFCVDYGFDQYVDDPTHIDGNRLDFVLSDLSLVHEVKTLHYISDHALVRSSLNLSLHQSQPQVRKVYEYHHANWGGICRGFADAD